MSRHRNVRSMNYNEEYDGYDDVYGHSVEDDSCISPSDAAQWIYDRNNRGMTQHGIGSYLDANKDIPEEDEDIHEDFGRRESVDLPQLSSLEKVKLASCLEEIKNVIGETIPEHMIVEIIIKHDFDLTKSLDAVLNNSASKEEYGKCDKKQSDKDFSPNCKNKNPMSLKDLMHSANKDSQNFKSINSKSISDLNSVKSETEFNSLDEMISFHLKSSNAGSNKFIIPKFNLNTSNNMPINQSLPKNDSTKSTSFLNQNAHNILTDKQSLKFVIPKFNLSSSNSGSNQNSEKPFKQVYETSRDSCSSNIHFKETSHMLENWHIDLSSALKNVSNQSLNHNVQNKSCVDNSLDENFIPQFIDCESEIYDIKMLDCCLNISNVLQKDLKYLTKKSSRFGRILCRSYTNVYIPIINHDYKILNKLQSFKFDVPSPDDNVQNFVKRQ